MTQTGFTPLNDVLPYWPTDAFGTPEFLDSVGFDDYELIYDEASERLGVEGSIVWFEELAVELPGLNGARLVALSVNDRTEVPFTAEVLPEASFEATGLSAAFELSTDLLIPVEKTNGEWQPRLDPDGSPEPIRMGLGSVDVRATLDGTFEVSGGASASLSAVAIGETGLVVELNGVTARFADDQPLPPDAPDGFRGLAIDDATMHLPDKFAVAEPDTIKLDNLLIGTGGFTGSITGEWTDDPAFDPSTGEFASAAAGSVAGFEFAPTAVELVFQQNVPTRSRVTGQLALPFFDAPLGVDIGIGPKGDLSVSLSAVQPDGVEEDEGLFTLRKEELLELTLSSFAFEAGVDGVAVALRGSITPLFQADVIDWPTVDIRELRIDADGNVAIDGGWLDLPAQQSLDFHGFTVELTKFGLGTTEDGRRWIGLNGGVKFAEELAAGVSVDGLQVTWRDDPVNPDPKLSFDGVGVDLEVPETLRLAGSVSYREFEGTDADGNPYTDYRFDGDVELDLLTLDISVDATLVVGTRETLSRSGPEEFSFFAVYLGVELPRGIPLFGTGLALYGMAGLFALGMRPNKGLPDGRADEEWYHADRSQSYYHRNEPGVTDLKHKWDPAEGALAVGAGVTLGTAPDNGFSFNGRLLLVISLPGPVVLLQGRANVLKDRADLDGGEPNFGALAVLDNRAGSFTFGLDANYRFGDGGELVDIGATTEAYYSLTDPMAWYLYIGRKEPRDQRVTAELYAGLFKANGYFMLDPRQFALGGWVGFDESYRFGPLGVDAELWIDGNAVLSFNPAHFYGDLTVKGGVSLSAFGLDLGISVEAMLAADVFDPFHLLGRFRVALELPWPLDDVGATVTLEWGPEPDPPTLPKPLKEAAIEHPRATVSWPLPPSESPDPVDDDPYPPLLIPRYGEDGLLYPDGELPAPGGDATMTPPAKVPVVPLDARPQLTFNRSVHDDAEVGDNRSRVRPAYERLGDPSRNVGPVEVRYGLAGVTLQRWEPADGRWVDDEPVFGSWAPMPRVPERDVLAGTDPAFGNTKLWLFSNNPYAYTLGSTGAFTDALERRYGNYPCSGARRACYGFDGLGDRDIWVGRAADGGFGAATEVTRIGTSEPWPVFRWAGFGFDGTTVSVEPSSVFVGGETVPPTVLRFVPAGGDEQHDRIQFLGLALPEPRRSVTVRYRVGKGARKAVLFGTDEDGETIPAIDTIEGRNGEFSLTITAPEGQFATVQLVLAGWRSLSSPDAGEVELVEVCTATADLSVIGGVDTDRVEAMQAGLQRWGDTGQVFDPHTTYRLVVETTVDARGVGEFDWYTRTESVIECAHFRTEGPPALANLSVPIGTADPANADTGLDDLSRYVDRTVPATTRASSKSVLPRPVFRAYDTAVQFTEQYVDLMYRVAGRDLTLVLFDANNRPARAIDGSLLVTENPWSVGDEAVPFGPDDDWLRTVTRRRCLEFDIERVRRPDRLAATVGLLSPDTRYEARLLPRLLRDGYGDDRYHEIGRPDGTWRTVDRAMTGRWMIDGHPTRQGTEGHMTGSTIKLDEGSPLTDVEPKLDIIRLHGATHDETAGTDGKTYAITDVRAADATVEVDGTPDATNPTTWTIPGRGVLRQMASPSPVAIGETTLVYTGRTGVEPATWTDYRVRTTVAFEAGGADEVGVVLRYDLVTDEHYRLTLNRRTGQRELAYVNGTTRVTLAEDHEFDGVAGVAVAVSVEAVGGAVHVYQDGAPVFAVEGLAETDTWLRSGTVGFTANAHARFDPVTVDDVSEAAPVAYRYSFTTSEYANFTHLVGSYGDDHWSADARRTLESSAGVQAKSGAASEPPSTAEARAHETLSRALPGERTAVDAIEVTRVRHLDNENLAVPAAFLVESPEPFDWRRTSLTVSKAPLKQGAEDARVRPGDCKLTNATIGSEEVVGLLCRETIALDSYRVELRPNGAGEPGRFASPLANPKVVSDFTSDPRSEYVFSHTEADGGVWTFEDGVLTYDGSVEANQGTAVIRASAPTEAVWTATVEPTDATAGLIFRHSDDTTYYRFILTDRGRELTRMEGGVANTLWADDVVQFRSSVTLRVIAEEGCLRGYVDGRLAFVTPDPGGSRGGVGVLAGGNGTVTVRSLGVYGAATTQPLFEPDLAAFDTSDSAWRVVDEPPETTRTSDWQVVGDELCQLSNIYGFAGGSHRHPGTVAVSTVGVDWRDYRLTVRLQSDDNDAIGAVVRWIDPENFYRFAMDSEREYREFVRVADGETTVLWRDEVRFEAGREYALTVDCVGTELTVFLDGVELCRVKDDSHAAGTVGLYCRANVAARFRSVRVEVPAGGWLPYHEFAEPTPFPAGTQVRVHTGPASDQTGAGIETRQRETAVGTLPRLPPEGATLRLVGPNGVEHQRRFRPAAAYRTVPDARLLRNADGTAFWLLVDDMAPGEYRLSFGYRRDRPTPLTQAGDGAPERAVVDIPWRSEEVDLG